MKVVGQLLLAVALSFTACAAEASKPQKLRVLTSILPLYSFAANIAGDSAEVENLLPANVSPHDFQFSRRDLQKVQRADLVIANGLQLEEWLQRLLRSSGKEKQVVEASAGLEAQLIFGTTPLKGGAQTRPRTEAAPNPHVWLDPVLARQMVTNILDAFVKADPAHQAQYKSNAAKYLQALAKLDQDFEAGLAPMRGRAIVTLHDAFPYLTRRYGLELAGVLEQVPDVDPSARYLKAFQEVVRAEKIRVLFVEPHYSSRMVRQLGKDMNLRVAELDTLETGPLKADTYEKSMRQNLRTLIESLSPAAHASETQK